MKYCKDIFESEPKVQPTFDSNTCLNYFKEPLHCKNKSRTFVFPEWMTHLQPPHSECDMSPLLYDEVARAVKRLRSGASPCPFDHVSVLILKNFPMLRTHLHKILQYCWEIHSVQKTWKHGFTVLIYKKGVSSNPANFRPITLEPVYLKVLSSIVRRRLYSFLVKNNYIESEIQKGFWDNIPGTIGHTEMLTYMINHDRKRQRDLVITLIDLRNAFGEVHHSPLRRVLHFHHIPHELGELILEMYRDFYVTIGTMGYTTCPITLERGVLQGDC